MTFRVIRSVLALCALLVAAPAIAADAPEVGKISVLDGSGTRVGKDGASAQLSNGLPIRVGDTITLERGRAKITLNDESTLSLAVASEGEKKAVLTVDEASFKNQVRDGFVATLGIGKLWAKVKKAVGGSDAKFEVKTERAVAGVRGTIFRVDAVTLVKGSRPNAKPKKRTSVWVTKGVVGVQSTGKAKDNSPKAKGPRQQVSGPQEITKDAWEQRFAELQKGMAVVVDDELWTMKPMAAPKDDLDAFVQKHDDQNDE